MSGTNTSYTALQREEVSMPNPVTEQRGLLPYQLVRKGTALKIKATRLTCTSTRSLSSFTLGSSGGTGKFELTFPGNSAPAGPSLSSCIVTNKKANW